MSSLVPRTAGLVALAVLALAPATAQASFANDFGVEVTCVAEASATTYVATFHWVSAHDVQMVQTGASNTVTTSASPGAPPTTFAANGEGDWVTAPVPKGATVRWQLGGASDLAAWRSSPRCYEAPSAVGVPEIAGTFEVGSTITAVGPEFRTSAASWERRYHWWIGCETAQSGEVIDTDEPRLVLRPQDAGHAVKVFVQLAEPYFNGTGASAESACDTDRRVGTAPSSTAAPTIAGAAILGGTLTLEGGGWAGSAPLTPSTRWEACTTTTCVPVGTGASYVPVAADVGKTIRAAVAGANAFGSLTVVTAPTAPVAAGAASTGGGGGGLQVSRPAASEEAAPPAEEPTPDPPAPPPVSPALKSTAPAPAPAPAPPRACLRRADDVTYNLRRQGFAGRVRVTVWRGGERVATDVDVHDRMATIDVGALPRGRYRVVLSGQDDEGEPLRVERVVRLC